MALRPSGDSTPSPSSPPLEALTAGLLPAKDPHKRARGLFVTLGALVALGLASRVPATSDQSPSDANHAYGVTWSKEIAPISSSIGRLDPSVGPAAGV